MQECRSVLETVGAVYRNDALAAERNLSPEERLLRQQIDGRKVERNSGLGEAIDSRRKHSPKLTLVLQQPGAPLGNNLCERASKMAILHRRNSPFSRSQLGARVGDVYMSLIDTAERCEVAPLRRPRCAPPEPPGCPSRARGLDDEELPGHAGAPRRRARDAALNRGRAVLFGSGPEGAGIRVNGDLQANCPASVRASA